MERDAASGQVESDPTLRMSGSGCRRQVGASAAGDLVIDYAALKAVHVGAVALSGALFALRGAWRLARPDAAFPLPARVLPHFVDTVLLLSALALAASWIDEGLPLGWIGAKVLLLAAYIGIGMVALRRGLRPGPRLAALAAAALAFGCIVSVALTKSPAGALRPLA